MRTDTEIVRNVDTILKRVECTALINQSAKET